VYRGVFAFCTSCGALRAPLAGPSVNLAGKPSKLGGAVATTAGWIVMLFGGSLALGVGTLFGAIFSLGVALSFSLPIAIVAGGIGLALLRGGKRLQQSGAHAERSTREQALLAMAGGGPASAGGRYGVTALMAARGLGIPVDEVDAMLTALAKSDSDRMTVDLDDQGIIWYRSTGAPAPDSRRVRVDGGVRADAGAREEQEDQAPIDDVARSGRR
jgi:hypothetical protein